MLAILRLLVQPGAEKEYSNEVRDCVKRVLSYAVIEIDSALTTKIVAHIDARYDGYLGDSMAISMLLQLLKSE